MTTTDINATMAINSQVSYSPFPRAPWRLRCSEWNWRNAAGRLKDMACRTLLLQLEARGQIRLPRRRTASVKGARNQSLAEVTHEQSPIPGELEAWRPLQLEPLAEASGSAP